jgi:quercetin dioxygenase-like cupin family protein
MIILVSTTIESSRLRQSMTIETDTDGAAVMEAVLEPGARVPLHRHLAQDERFEIRDGAARFRLGLRVLQLRPGDTVQVPAGQAHAVRNAGSVALVLTARLTPARRSAEFFADLFAEADAGHVSRGGRPSPAALARLARKYGDDLPWLPVVPVRWQRLVARLPDRRAER